MSGIRDAAWVTLNREENTLRSFWAYIFTALNMLVPDLAQAELSLLHSPQSLRIERLCTTIINKLTVCNQKLILVLDDYHLIDDPSIHDSVAFWLEHAPANLHWIISSRVEPPLSLSLLHMRGQLSLLTFEDLRFIREETRKFFSDDPEYTEQQLISLEQQTEGWIAGLHLASVE
jgi:LuxR family maltose regulon positive regulatory protein